MKFGWRRYGQGRRGNGDVNSQVDKTKEKWRVNYPILTAVVPYGYTDEVINDSPTRSWSWRYYHSSYKNI